MLRPFHSIAEGAALDSDICIIGTGPAGLTIARALERTGLRIIMIEAGSTQVEPSTQDAYAGEVVDPVHPPSQMYRQRRLGGSSGIWGGRCTPLDELDFVKRDHVPLSGWPFSRATLEPYYRQAQEELEVGAYDYHAHTALGGRPLIEGFDDPHVSTDNIELYSPPTRFWKRHRQALTRSTGITIVDGATCLHFNTGDDRRAVRTATCVGVDGRRFTVSAQYFVAAVGGLEIVRLLGFSELSIQSNWLGRTYMCHTEVTVGGLRVLPRGRSIAYGFERTGEGIYAKRRFTVSAARQAELGILNAAVRVHHPSILDPAHRASVLSALFLARRFVIPEYARHFSIRKSEAPAHTFSLVDAHSVMQQLVNRPGFIGHHVRNVAMDLPGLARFGVQWIGGRYLARRKIPYIALRNKDGVYALNLYGEQAPNPDSRVTLGSQLDRQGVPRLKVDWRAQDIDYRTAAHTIYEIKRALEASGVGTADIDEARFDDEVRQQTVPVGGHHIGTARMADEGRDGVVTPDCLVHGTANLYVAGAAVFPTSGQANPTLTIVALALRLADHLASQLVAV
jgi:choline dehydrogenase-like flavoprotein